MNHFEWSIWTVILDGHFGRSFWTAVDFKSMEKKRWKKNIGTNRNHLLEISLVFKMTFIDHYVIGQFLAPGQFETSSKKSLKENKRGRTRYKRVKVRYIVHNDDGTRTVCKPPERKPWVHRHRISIGYWATHGLGKSSLNNTGVERDAVIPGSSFKWPL